MDTSGDTGYTAQAVLNEWLPQNEPTYGDAYYKGVFAVIPNLIPSVIDFGKITEQSSCAIRLQKSGVLDENYQNIGGSFLGEIFMNFGVTSGIFVCFLWGLFFGSIGRRSVIAIHNDDLYNLIFYISVMLASIYWVRSYFGGGIREVVWDGLLGYYIVRKYISHKIRRNENVSFIHRYRYRFNARRSERIWL